MATPVNSPLKALWSARSVAVIGASDRAGAPGRLPIEFLQRYGYQGAILPVRPDGATVLGLASFATVQDCPSPVDLAMILVSADRVAKAVDDCIEAGVPVAIICSSGFAETGEEGAALQDEIVAMARAGGMRLIGPNCIGTVGVRNRQVTSFSPLFAGVQTQLVGGSLAFVSQSGALGYGAVSLAFERGLGLGWIVNTGNEADVNAVEVMAALAEEPTCRGLLAYVETLDDIESLRRVAASGMPVVMLKAGRSDAGQRAAASHTGALAAGDLVVDAALRQLGIVRVNDVDELLDVGDAFAQPRRATGRRVAIVTTSGGSGILAADAVEASGLELATFSPATQSTLDEIVPAYGATANPVDVTATVMSNAELFDRTLDAIVDDEGVDLVVACFCVLTGKDVDDVVASLSRAAKRSGKPVLAARTGAAQASHA
jgi:acyl-CoA synthetase (NDP forming)